MREPFAVVQVGQCAGSKRISSADGIDDDDFRARGMDGAVSVSRVGALSTERDNDQGGSH